MFLAAQKGTPVARLVMNDAGPVISRASLERIGMYLGKWPPLPTIEAAEAYVRTVSAPFGPHSDAEWRFLTEVAVRKNAEGGYRMNYDPRIAEPYKKALPEKDLEFWPVWDQIRCPTFVLRGADRTCFRARRARRWQRAGRRRR
jgi:pimeloyl-ACP methyl ester carboxylesterase